MTYRTLMRTMSITTLICLVLSAAYPLVIAFQFIAGLGILAIVILLCTQDRVERGEQ